MKNITIFSTAKNLLFTTDWIFYQIKDQYFKTDFISTLKITIQDFYTAKYGNNNVAPYEKNEEVAIMKNGNTLRCFYQTSIVREFSKEGLLLREFPHNISMMNIYSLAVDFNDNIWIAEPAVHRIAQLNYQTGEVVFEIGGTFEDDAIVNHPEDIYYEQNQLFISDMGNNRIAKLNTINKELTTYLQFEQSTWLYRTFKGKEYVLLDNGIFEL